MNPWQIVVVGGTFSLDAKAVYCDQEGTITFMDDQNNILLAAPKGCWVSPVGCYRVKEVANDR